ncbi:hypothetical protein EKH83_07765 [Arcticibacter tournemirensis]|uniref:HNH domain-containing protein n=2 Tax=Arcticibacter tournemirensis TaxID=699437 RepID=A0A4Q0MB65_9SPHI|nr:hypothetical protein EKH83_07765 [Arcticibacter tournemirensis]
MTDWNLLADDLANRFSLELSGKAAKGQNGIFRVESIDAPNGFTIEINVGWRSVDATFRPDTFAAALLRTIKGSSEIQKQEFLNLISAFTKRGTKTYLKGQLLSGVETADNLDLNGFDLICVGFTDHSDDSGVILETVNACIALILSLLPIENISEDLEENGAALEGAYSRIEVNRYERNPANRAAAIAFHGAFCQVCGFDFRKVYGSIGHGYIEVHHLVPVSELGGTYAVNPITDLLPLCANCHSMVHRKNPPMSPEELKAIMKK